MLAYLYRGKQILTNLFRPRKKLGWISFVFIGVLLLTVFLLTTPSAAAKVWDFVAEALSKLSLMLATLFLKLTIFILTFIIQIAAYNGYIDSTAVNYGWVMVRDVTNMGFVVILLIIAFGTILGLEQYEWKKMMVKFVLAAILVNFSRVICGVMIDVGQVIMTTFINGVAATAGGNLINMFNFQDIMQLTGDQPVATTEVLMASVAALGFAALAMGTMFVFLVILAARMLTLWVLIVLSPLAFVLSVIPQTQKYASEWWQNFGNNVVSGPVVAFFLWLAFVTVGGGNINDEIASKSQTDIKTTASEADAVGATSAGITSAMSWEKMANFVIAIGMLLVGAKTAQQLGVTGGSMMSKATDFAKKAATIGAGVFVGKWLYDKAGGAKGIAKTVGMNIPLVGGKSWQRRGLAVKDVALQGAEWWNKKVGSRVGSIAQFGAHDKIMKERKDVIEKRKGNLSSSAKGYQGLIREGDWGKIKSGVKGAVGAVRQGAGVASYGVTADGLKQVGVGILKGLAAPFTQGFKSVYAKKGERAGGIEDYRAYVDHVTGEQELNKGRSDTERSVRREQAKVDLMQNNQEVAKKVGKAAMEQEAVTADLETAKGKVRLDILAGTLHPGMGDNFIRAYTEREAQYDAVRNSQTLLVERRKGDLNMGDHAESNNLAEIKALATGMDYLTGLRSKMETAMAQARTNAAGKSGTDLDPIKQKLNDDLSGLFQQLPQNLRAEVEKDLRARNLDTNNPQALGDTMRRILLQPDGADFTAAIAPNNLLTQNIGKMQTDLNNAVMTYGKKGNGGVGVSAEDWRKQLDVLTAIKREIAKERDRKGAGNFDIFKQFDPAVIRTMFGVDSIDRNTAMRLESRNLIVAEATLMHLKKQANEAAGQKPSLYAAATRVVRPQSTQPHSTNSKVTLEILNRQNSEQSKALADILKQAGLSPNNVDSLSPFDEDAIVRKINENADVSKLRAAGIDLDDLVALIKDLRAGNGELARILKTKLS